MRAVQVGIAKAGQVVDRLRALQSRPDFRRSPWKAAAKRVIWRARWLLWTDPWELRMRGGLRIMVPRSGAGALIFYQGLSEPWTAELICRFLQPGMVFWDVGAHIGEYTLLAAARVGQSGEVHAFEPNPESFRLLQRNVIRNGFTQVVLNRVAVADVTEERVFRMDVEPSLSRLVCGTTGDISERLIRVDAVRLDDYSRGRRRPHLIKIDTEGAEGLVLRGMHELLAQPADKAPVPVFEYSPANYRAFGYDARELLALLEAVGYQVYLPAKARLVPLRSTDRTPRPLENNLWAAKNSARLTGLMSSECVAYDGDA